MLVVSPFATHPPHAGNSKRLFVLLQRLQERGFSVDFLQYDARSVLQERVRETGFAWDRFSV